MWVVSGDLERQAKSDVNSVGREEESEGGAFTVLQILQKEGKE